MKGTIKERSERAKRGTLSACIVGPGSPVYIRHRPDAIPPIDTGSQRTQLLAASVTRTGFMPPIPLSTEGHRNARRGGPRFIAAPL
jgi:hypothetical protein